LTQTWYHIILQDSILSKCYQELPGQVHVILYAQKQAPHRIHHCHFRWVSISSQELS